MDKVKLLERIDILRALYNSYIEKKIMSEINIEYYKMKKDNPRNGEDISKIKTNILTAERNLEDYAKMVELLKKKIEDHEHQIGKMN